MKSMIVVAVAMLMLSGCGGGSQGAADEASSSTPSSSSPAAATPTTSPSATKTDPFAPNIDERALEVGQPRIGRGITTRVIAVRPDWPGPSYASPGKNKRWFGINIRTCVKRDQKQSDPVSWLDWAVVDEDYASWTGSGTSWGDFPTPQYPPYGDIRPGECRQGWIVASMPRQARADRVVFAPDGEAVAEWVL